MLKKVNKKFILNPNFNINNRFESWTIPVYEKIKKTYYISDEIKHKFSLDYILRYPGFIFNVENEALLYYEKIYRSLEETSSKYEVKNILEPRGSFTMHSLFIIGIAPGDSIIDYKYPCWLLGSSKTLIKLLLDLNKVAYFTNIFKTQFLNNKINYTSQLLHNSLQLLYNEINLFKQVNNNNITIVLLGLYKEFDYIRNKYKNDKIIQILHPSYVQRFNKYDEWKSDVIKKLQNGEI